MYMCNRNEINQKPFKSKKQSKKQIKQNKQTSQKKMTTVTTKPYKNHICGSYYYTYLYSLHVDVVLY